MTSERGRLTCNHPGCDWERPATIWRHDETISFTAREVFEHCEENEGHIVSVHLGEVTV